MLVLTFRCMGTRDQTQILRLGRMAHLLCLLACQTLQFGLLFVFVFSDSETISNFCVSKSDFSSYLQLLSFLHGVT